MFPCDALFHELSLLEGKYLSFLEALCNIESPTDCKYGLDAAGALIAEHGRALGFAVEIIPQSRAGDLVRVSMCCASSARPIILSAHIDTVHPIGSFGKPAVRIEGDRIFGPGVLDDKGGAVAALYAMEALARCGYQERPIIFIAQTDEEVGSALSRGETIGYICREAMGCEAFINCESLHPGVAILERKGILRYRFVIRGRVAHAARCDRGASAVLEAAYKIIEIEKYKDPNGITCSCSLLSGGEVANSVPGRCEFAVDVRVGNKREQKEIEAALAAIAHTAYVAGTECELIPISARPAMERSTQNLDFLEKINRIYAENGMQTLAPGRSVGGSDAANVALLGVRVIDSLGCEGGGMHTTGEYAYLRSLKEAAARIASIIYRYDEV